MHPDTSRTRHTTTFDWGSPSELRALLHLLHLVSPALPLGGYAYSQGLEYAVQAGWVRDESTAHDWIGGIARAAVGTLDLPILLRLYRAWRDGNAEAIEAWNAKLLAARETAELRAEDHNLGAALARVLEQLDMPHARPWRRTPAALATLFSLAAFRWAIPEEAALAGYLWAWSENQVLCALRLVPLGQSAGQRLLKRLGDAIPEVVSRASALEDAQICVSAFGQPLASALHETQYTRLFRS